MQTNTGKQQNGKDQRFFKKNRDSKGTFHAKMGTIKNRNGQDLTETEEMTRIHRRTYTNKILMTQKITMMWSLRHPGA